MASGALLQAERFGNAGLGAGGSCCSRGEEVAAAAEQREAPPLSHLVRQRVYRAET